MVISTKGRYALRLMIDLAQHCDEGFISLKTVSQRQDVSVKYMEAIAAALNRATAKHKGTEAGEENKFSFPVFLFQIPIDNVGDAWYHLPTKQIGIKGGQSHARLRRQCGNHKTIPRR